MTDAGPPPWLTSMIDQAEMAERDRRADQPAARSEHRCVAPPSGCGQPIASLATAFRDQASRAEYDITGLCQSCQDIWFAPDEEEVAEMAADPENYGRCGVCGEYRQYETVDVGIGVMKGFDCCPPEDGLAMPRCVAEGPSGQCLLRQDHRHNHEWNYLGERS